MFKTDVRRLSLLMALVLLASLFTGYSALAETPDEYVIQVLALPKVAVSRSDETSVGKVIKEKFGIVFEYLPLTGDEREKQNLLLATGDYPELLSLQNNDMVNKYAKAGALLELDDYFANSTHMKEAYAEQIPYWRAASVDGKLYKWEHNIPQDKDVDPEYLDIAVRSDLLEQQGWPNLVSEDDWFKFLQKALELNPQTNGQKTIGLTFPMGESWGPALSIVFNEKGGLTNDQSTNDVVVWNQVEQRWVEVFKNRDARDNLRWLNRLYRAGLLDRDIFTDTSDQTSSKCDTGRAAAVWYCTWNAFSANSTLMGSGNGDMQYIHMPIRSNAQVEAGLPRECRVETTRPFNSCVITKNCTDPDRLFAFVDWCASEEGQILLQSGLEGEQYEIVDGKRVPTESYINGTMNDATYDEFVGFNMGCNILPMHKKKGADGVAYSLKSEAAYKDELFLTDRQKEAYAALGWSSSMQYWSDTSVAAPNGLTGACVLEPGSDMAKLDEKYIAWCPAAYTKLMVAEDFDATLAELDAEYDRLGFAAVCDEYNRLLAEAKANLEKFL